MIAAESITLLRAWHVRLGPGLTGAELSAIEDRFGFAFSPDHRDFLSLAVPEGDGWIDWRGSDRVIDDALSWPAQGLMFDVEQNSFWPPSWGDAPSSLSERLGHAGDQIVNWPAQVPLYGHRYMPASPAASNSPVFSVWKSDVIVYGRNPLDYVQHDFGKGWTRRSAREHTPSVILRGLFSRSGWKMTCDLQASDRWQRIS